MRMLSAQPVLTRAAEVAYHLMQLACLATTQSTELHSLHRSDGWILGAPSLLTLLMSQRAWSLNRTRRTMQFGWPWINAPAAGPHIAGLSLRITINVPR